MSMTDSWPFNTFAKMCVCVCLFIRVANFVYELNAMAPTWLPKSHSPTAIKVTKSWIYSHCTQLSHFFLLLLSPVEMSIERYFIFFFVVVLKFELLSWCRWIHRFCCLNHFSIQHKVFNTLNGFSLWLGDENDKKKIEWTEWTNPFSLLL